MPLDEQQVKNLLAWVAATHEDEIHCDECLAGMAEFAEHQLVGTPIPDALKRIQDHIAACPECAEEYELLRDIVTSMAPDATRPI